MNNIKLWGSSPWPEIRGHWGHLEPALPFLYCFIDKIPLAQLYKISSAHEGGVTFCTILSLVFGRRQSR